MLTIQDNWERLFDRDTVGALEALLPSALASARWYGGKARTVAAVRIHETVPLRIDTDCMVLLFVDISYNDEGHDIYSLLLTASFDERAVQIQETYPQAVVATVTIVDSNGDRPGVLHDALWDQGCAGALLRAIYQGNDFQGKNGTLLASSSPA